MRFSFTTVLSLSMVSMALALPYDAEVVKRDTDVSATETKVYSDTGSVVVDLGLAERDVDTQEDEDSSVQWIGDVIDTDDTDLSAIERRAGPTLSGGLTNAGTVVNIVNAMFSIGTQVDKIVKNLFHDDNKRRQRFTQQTVSDLRKKFPKHNFVMSNVAYDFQGKIITRKQVFFHTKIGKAISFDVIAFKHGIFRRRGDGGFQNWAYSVDSVCVRKPGYLHC